MYNEFRRQPRFFPQMPVGEIEIPNPPSAYEKPEISWFMLLAPPAVMLVITVLIAMSMQSVFMMISIATTIMTLVGSLVGASTQIKKYKKKKKERESKYSQFIADTRSELSIAKEQQQKAMREINPTPNECIQRIMHIDHKLWERTPSYSDFLALRMGIGTAPLSKHIKYTKQAVIMESDPLIMEPHKVAMEFEKVTDVPVSLNLVESGVCGVAGEKGKTLEFVKHLLLQIITHHGYDDVKIVLLISEENLEHWDWLRFLPHLWDDAYSIRYYLCGKTIAHQTLSELDTIIKERDMKTVSGNCLPHFVFIVEEPQLLEDEPINKYIYNESTKIGVSSLFIAPNPAFLPTNCNTVITLQGNNGETIDRKSGNQSVFTPDQSDFNHLDLASRSLASVRIKNSSVNFSLPKSITLMEMLQIKKVDDINVNALWEHNRTYKGMRVPIGARAGKEFFDLDMHETGHGPHGLVAGTTGSGKSELLQTIIISLAVHYHPHDIAFVLIDYKGGGMADIFMGMPHLVGTITNLGGNQTSRALLSIKSELMRRQRLFSEYEVNNIDKYQKLYYSDNNKKTMPAIPHLIMIADEFAELKQDQPDFMKELVSTARVGRSLGVHLILATQKPAGVVDDQIWSNSKFKICLKVQDVADSKDVIKRPDAAMIKEPGRAYIQVGNDEIFELFQSTFSGADYDPTGEMKKSENKTKRIFKIGLNGRSRKIHPIEEEKIAKKELPSQLKAMVEYIISQTEKNNIEALKGPWLPPLKEIVYLDDLYASKIDKTEFIELWKNTVKRLAIPVGIIDNPREQLQKPLVIDFIQDGNLFVYGAPSTGKTYLLRTLCLSLAYAYSPSDINIYVLDFGGSSFKTYEQLPHCGGVVTLEQESKLNQFMLFMFRTIEERKKLFEEKRRDGFADYRAQGGQIPGIVIMIDNYFALSETYEDVAEKMIVLAREGSKYGIFFVSTATNASMVRYKFAVNFKSVIALTLTDASEYESVVGRTEGIRPLNIPGRALIRNNPPLEVQIALPECKEMDTKAIVELFEKNIQENHLPRAVPIPIMPAFIDIIDINKDHDEIAIGLGDADLQPVYINFMQNPVFMIAGEPLSGKSTVLMTLIKLLCEKEGVDYVDIYALDSINMGIYSVMEMPNVTDIARIEDTEVLIENIQQEIKKRRDQLIECRRKNGNVGDIVNTWKHIIFIFDNLIEMTTGDNYLLKELLEKIVKNERGMKITIIAAGNLSDMESDWDSLGKAIREEQNGILMGSMKEQNLFGARMPYGTQEKEIETGDGYYIIKSKYIGLRTARYQKTQ